MTIDDRVIRAAGPDPLGIRASCAVVVNSSSLVTIDRGAVETVAADLADRHVPAPEWDDAIHFRETGPAAIEHTAGWIFVLDALNFCFWAQGDDPSWRWRVTIGDETYDGYIALARALREAAQNSVPIWDPMWLSVVDADVLADILAPAAGSASIPLLTERVSNLRELGAAMLELNAGETPFSSFIEKTRTAPDLVQAVIEVFPSFNDIAVWELGDGSPSVEIRFHKRAQILVSDLAGALSSEICLPGIETLTAFADYKVPQVLREVGILNYRGDLATMLRRRELIPAGSRAEIEIRAATIWGCELVRQALAERGRTFTASEVDWLLWNQGQQLPGIPEPYHRTRTIFY